MIILSDGFAEAVCTTHEQMLAVKRGFALCQLKRRQKTDLAILLSVRCFCGLSADRVQVFLHLARQSLLASTPWQMVVNPTPGNWDTLLFWLLVSICARTTLLSTGTNKQKQASFLRSSQWTLRQLYLQHCWVLYPLGICNAWSHSFLAFSGSSAHPGWWGGEPKTPTHKVFL